MKICKIDQYIDADTGRSVSVVTDVALSLPIQAVGSDRVVIAHETPLGPSSREVTINFEIEPVTPKLAALFENFDRCRDKWIEENLPEATPVSTQEV
jgi:hypothetical protein